MTVVFADTNIAIYAFDQDTAKAQKAEAIMDGAPVISTQVVIEFLNICRVKLGFDLETRHRLALELMRGCPVITVDCDVIADAMRVEARYGLSWWDSLIVAAALLAGCGVLYSEDMQDGLVIDGRLTIVNPLK